jgi:hypothetical protein
MFSIRNVAITSGKVWLKNVLPFALIMFLCNLPPLTAALLFIDRAAAAGGTVLVFSGLALLLAGKICEFTGYGAIAYGAVMHQRDSEVSFADCISKGLGGAWRSLVVAFVVAVCVAVASLLFTFPAFIAVAKDPEEGFTRVASLLFTFPAFIVMCVFFVAVPCASIEGHGLGGALNRSAYLTSGHRWACLGIIILLSVVGWGVDGLGE